MDISKLVYEVKKLQQSKGFKVLPVIAKTKAPFLKNWPNLASSDPEAVDNWAAAFKNKKGGLGFGVATGEGSDVDVMDIDGPEALAAYKEKFGDLPHTWKVKTPREEGGWHIYFRHNDRVQRNMTSVLINGIDIKTNGGMVVLPPTINGEGRGYQWEVSPFEAELADWPSQILDVLDELSVFDGHTYLSIDDVWDQYGQNDTIWHYAYNSFTGKNEAKVIEILLDKWQDGGIPDLDPAWPWTAQSIEDTAWGAIKSAKKKFHDPVKLPDGNTIQFQAVGGNSDEDAVLRIAHYFGEDIRFVRGLGFFYWDTVRWVHDTDAFWVRQLVKRLPQLIKVEAGAMAAKAHQMAARSLSKKLLNGPRQNRIVDMLEMNATIRMHINKFDGLQSLYLVNFLNGTLDLRTGELRPHSKDDYMTKLIEESYDPEAKCPTFMESLHYAFPDTEEGKKLCNFYQMETGHALTGAATEVLYILYGPDGRNAKSTLEEAVYRAMGTDYASSTSVDTFLDKSNSNFRFSAIAQMRGRRLAIASEANKGDALDVAFVKLATGGDTMTVKFMGQDTFDMRIEFSFHIRTNHKPKIEGIEDHTWRRLCLIPFDQQVPVNKLRPRATVDADIDKERPGILAWLVEGAIKRHRLQPVLDSHWPEVVKLATRQYRSESSPMFEFLEQCFDWVPDGLVLRSEFNKHLKAWSREYKLGRQAPTKGEAKKYLEQLHGDTWYEKKGSDGQWYYCGLQGKADKDESKFGGMVD